VFAVLRLEGYFHRVLIETSRLLSRSLSFLLDSLLFLPRGCRRRCNSGLDYYATADSVSQHTGCSRPRIQGVILGRRLGVATDRAFDSVGFQCVHHLADGLGRHHDRVIPLTSELYWLGGFVVFVFNRLGLIRSGECLIRVTIQAAV